AARLPQRFVSFWNLQSTETPSVTQPSLTVTLILSSGMVTLDLIAFIALLAISASVPLEWKSHYYVVRDRFNLGSGCMSFRFKVLFEPLGSKARHLFQCARLFEQVGSTGHYLDFFLTLKLTISVQVQVNNLLVTSANDQ